MMRTLSDRRSNAEGNMQMLTYMLTGVGVLAFIAWKVLKNATDDDKQRKTVKRR